MTKAIVFPGQGSQAVGMLAELYETSEVVRDSFNEASSALGYDMWAVVSKDENEQLNQTEYTQPALLTCSVAIWRDYVAKGGELPRYLAGHSLGEYSALVCAEVLTLADAVLLVQKRGQYMQQAVPAGTGAMAAIIGLDDELVSKACVDAANGDVVAPVNYNSPGQIVIAGEKSAVERAMLLAKELGAKRALPLPVSVPSHCALMKPAADKLEKDLQQLDFNTPVIPVINNVDVAAPTSADEIKQALVKQLYSPVRWTETIQQIHTSGVTDIYEFGPGKVLTGLGKRIVKEINYKVANDTATVAALVAGE